VVAGAAHDGVQSVGLLAPARTGQAPARREVDRFTRATTPVVVLSELFFGGVFSEENERKG
jgi:hypothetical protein